MLVLIMIVAIGFISIYLITNSKSFKEKQYNKTDEYRKNANGQIFCPHCGCTQIAFDTKKKNHCMKCGFDWYPWQYEHLYKN